MTNGNRASRVPPDASATWLFRLERSTAYPGPFVATLRVCDNPCCDCTHVTVLCQEADPGSETPSVRRYAFPLDVGRRMLVTDGSAACSPEELRFARAYVAELDAGEWERLWRLFSAAKLASIEGADPEHLRFAFDVAAIENESILVQYPEVFPFADPLPFPAAPIRHFVIDHYCVREACTCREVHLDILSNPAERGGKPVREGQISYSYGTGSWKPHSGEGNSRQSLQPLVDELLGAHPDLSEVLRGRHAFLRRAYAAFRRRSPAVALRTSRPQAGAGTGKIGRNAPCPCGSGRKYKHCCGR